MSREEIELKAEASSAAGNPENSELKMITFTLADKDYGIDIMQVKEISRMMEFTYIPNAPFYVRGVYNLRGEIISVIDLRLLFHLPVPEKEPAASDEDVENLIVLQFGDYYLGVVVDRVDKVCSVRAADVQPVHPLFSDISIKYINGLAHYDGRLYILLNVGLLADSESAGGFISAVSSSDTVKPVGHRAVAAPEAPVSDEGKGGALPVSEAGENDCETDSAEISEGSFPESRSDSVGESDNEKSFAAFTEGLETFCGFYINDWNRQAIRDIFFRYIEENGSAPVFRTAVEYSQLMPFLNPQEESLWPNEYFDAVKSLNPDFSGKHFNVWSSWCGYGYDAYSVAAAFLSIDENLPLRVWATDDDLLKISMGPNLTVQNVDPATPLIDYVEETKSGFKFKKLLAEKLLFEYHSIENGNPFPKMKFIVAKGKISYYNKETAGKIIGELYAKSDSGSYIMTADYESLPESDFRLVYSGSIRIFQRI